MAGITHPYYTVALPPAVAALIGISVRELWRGREFLSCRATLATMSACTGVWAFVLLNRTPDGLPALRWIVVVGSIATAAAIAVRAHRLGRAAAAVAATALLLGLAAPAAYSIARVARSLDGPMPTAGSSGVAFGPDGETGHRNVPLTTLLCESCSQTPKAVGLQHLSAPCRPAALCCRPVLRSWRSAA